ncbi:hypothetical protein B0813_003273 [Candidatus Fervidibacteria bacterium JGI MDM2 SSWTFF-3-K9]
MPLSSYEPTALDTSPGIDQPDAYDFALGIWDTKIELSLIATIIGYPRFWLKRWRVRRLKRKWLPNFPQTLACPACLTVLPRKDGVYQ